MGRVIGICSGKGGVAKSTTAINLGIALHKFGRDVVIVDANLTTPNIGVYFGMPIPPVSLHHVLQGRYDIKDAIYMHPSGVKIIPGSISLEELKKTDPDKLRSVIKKLDNEIILLDCAAGLGNEVLNVIKAVDEVLIVSSAEMISISDALKTIKLVEEFDKEIIGIVLTRVNEYSMSIRDVETMLGKAVICAIPEDKAVSEALVKKEAVVVTEPNSKAAISYKRLAAKLIGEVYEEEGKGFFDRLLEFLGIK